MAPLNAESIHETTPAGTTAPAGVGASKKKSPYVYFAEKTAAWSGSASAFTIAFAILVVWGLTGPFFDYSDTWQLVINTGTTVVTFLMVFLIQNTQHRDARAVQLKLNELIRATEAAHSGLLDLEEMSEEELNAIRDKYLTIAREAHQRLKNGQSDMDVPDIAL